MEIVVSGFRVLHIRPERGGQQCSSSVTSSSTMRWTTTRWRRCCGWPSMAARRRARGCSLSPSRWPRRQGNKPYILTIHERRTNHSKPPEQGLDHMFYDKNDFLTTLESHGMCDIEFFPHAIPEYGNSSFRFNLICVKAP